MYTEKDHTFVICAYKENPHLEETIQSLVNQTVKSNIILSTSTPNLFLEEMCEKYQIRMVINPERKGAGADWNYGYNHAETEFVTVAHQDDYYESDFLEKTLAYANRCRDIILLYTDYYELRIDKKVTKNTLLRVKQWMNAPLKWRIFYHSKFIRRRSLSLGDAICCPAVTYHKALIGESPFDTKYINSCDYKTLVDLSKRKGAFVYIPLQLVAHRIYPDSATTRNLSENIRQKEDFEILCDFWPKWIARLINRVYAVSEKNNEI